MASEFLRQHREKQAARKLLLKIQMRADLAVRIEALSKAADANSAYWRQMFRRQYQRHIGVDVERSEELRQALEAIVAGGAHRVCHVLSRINAAPQLKGSEVGELSLRD